MTAMSKMQQTAWRSSNKLQPGKAYRVRKPAQPSSAATKMKNMAAACWACAGK